MPHFDEAIGISMASLIMLLVGCNTIESFDGTKTPYSHPKDSISNEPSTSSVHANSTQTSTSIAECIPVVSDSSIVDIDVGTCCAFAVRADGRVYGWGTAQHLGLSDSDSAVTAPDDDFVSIPYPVLLDGIENIVAVDTDDYPLMLSRSGEVYLFHEGQTYLLGDLEDVVQVKSSHRFIVARRSDGSVWFAETENIEDTAHWPADFTMIPINNVVDIAVRFNSFFLVKADGSLWQWANPSIPKRDEHTVLYIPQQIEVPDFVIDVEWGLGLWMLYQDRTMAYWRLDAPNQVYELRAMPDLNNIVQLDGNQSSSGLILRGDGQVFGVGKASILESPPYVHFEPLERIVQISGNSPDNLVLDDTGTVWAWGFFNTMGTLGVCTLGDTVVYPVYFAHIKYITGQSLARCQLKIPIWGRNAICLSSGMARHVHIHCQTS